MPTASRLPRVGNHDRVQQIISRLRKAEADEAVRDRRSADRKAIVRPVMITFGRDKHCQIQAMSNSLSLTGVGLIHEVEIPVGRLGVLTIHRLHEEPFHIRADVRWCQPFCDSWYASGWRFLAEERN